MADAQLAHPSPYGTGRDPLGYALVCQPLLQTTCSRTQPWEKSLLYRVKTYGVIEASACTYGCATVTLQDGNLSISAGGGAEVGIFPITAGFSSARVDEKDPRAPSGSHSAGYKVAGSYTLGRRIGGGQYHEGRVGIGVGGGGSAEWQVFDIDVFTGEWSWLPDYWK